MGWDCQFCHAGILFVYKRGYNGAPYMFKCTCNAGVTHEYQIPRWDQDLKEIYESEQEHWENVIEKQKKP